MDVERKDEKIERGRSVEIDQERKGKVKKEE